MPQVEKELDLWSLPEVRVKAEGNPVPPRGKWEHQNNAWNFMNKTYENDPGTSRSGIVVVPTGGGKTSIACNWLLRNHVSRGGRVLWLAHRQSLLRQAFKTFYMNAGLAAGREHLNLISVSSDDLPWSRVAADDDLVFSTIQSASKNKNIVRHMVDQSPHGLFVVVDEAHHGSAPSYHGLLQFVKDPKVHILGLTATPVRVDEKDQGRLQEVFTDQIIYQISMQELIRSGILAKPEPVTVNTLIEFEREFDENDIRHLEQYGDLSQKMLKRLASHAHRNQLIVRHYRENAFRYGKTIVFAANIPHAHTLVEEFNNGNEGIADYVDSSRNGNENMQVIERFRETDSPKILVNVEMLTEGFDAPKTRTVFLARPTASETLLRQMVGRALRGPRAGGNDMAYLVTFVDTWGKYDPVSTEYVLGDISVPPPTPPKPGPQPIETVPIPGDLIRRAYEVLKNLITRQEMSHYDCIPNSWYSWDEELDNDIIRRHVLVFDNQADAFQRMDREVFSNPGGISQNVTDTYAESIIRVYFPDVTDPIPSVYDLRSLLSAYKRGCEVIKHTVQQRNEIDPFERARDLIAREISVGAIRKEIDNFYKSHSLCEALYGNQGGFESFLKDVMDAMNEIVTRTERPVPRPPEEVPRNKLGEWATGEPGHDLTRIWDAVTGQIKHFPNGVPKVSEIRYSRKDMVRYWGFFRYSDNSLVISNVLNSPDVPRFVMEFLMYHEVLHADMPYSGHNRDYRIRESMFIPSSEALEEARQLNCRPGSTTDTWRIQADQFLDTIDKKFILPEAKYGGRY